MRQFGRLGKIVSSTILTCGFTGFVVFFFLAYNANMANRNTPTSRVLKMPKLTPTTVAVDVWFEQGMILFEDPSDPDQICRVTVDDFEERIHALSEMVDDLHDKRRKYQDTAIVDCDKRDWERFRCEVRELIRESRQQIHVGLPPDILTDALDAKTPVSVQPGFESKLWLPGDV